MVVRKKSGMPLIVMPMRLNAPMSPKQIVWQTCQEPKMLVTPEILPVIPTTLCFSPMGFAEQKHLKSAMLKLISDKINKQFLFLGSS